MSENKYIIDKDSLTGIADAVRDKLGAGEATTDSQTGDIIYPEDKGYYLEETTVAKISGFGWSYTGYSGNFGRNYSPLIEGTYWDEAVGEPWYSVEITLVNVSGNDFYDMDVYYDGNNHQTFTNVRSSTYTVSAPNGSTYFNLYFSNRYSSSRWNGSSSLGSLTAIFKDAEGKLIRPKQSSYQYRTYDQVVHTANFETENVPIPIPFSINDIQDKITNYLTCGGTLETWKLSNTDGTYLTFPSGFSIENLKDLTCYSNNYPRGLYKDSSGKPVSMKDQGISLPSSFSTIGYPLTVAKISTAHSEGRTFCIPWNWSGTKRIPDNTYFVWFVVEPNDSKIYLGVGCYANYVTNGNWTVIYT